MTVGAMFSNGRLSVHAGGKSYQILESDGRFKRVIKLLENHATEAQLVEALDAVKHVERQVSKAGIGKVEIKNGQVYLNGEVCHNAVAKRIIEFAEKQLPFKPLTNFLVRLMANPSFKSREQLYKFLEHKSLPITEDGMVLAYKAIKDDWTDKHTGKIDNSLGRTVEMDRSLIDDDPDNHCSTGLHVGALSYVNGFKSGHDRVVLVSFDPTDAVSVPKDANFEKLRVCKYKVVEEFKQELVEPLYNNDASSYNQDDDYYDEDDVESYDDEDEEDDEEYENIIPDNGKCCRGDCGSGQATIKQGLNDFLGVKPSGQGFHNKRDTFGRFTKK